MANDDPGVLDNVLRYAFGGDAPNTAPDYAALLNRQKLALVMAAAKDKGYPKNIGEGIAAIGDALGYRRNLADLSAREEAYQKYIAAQQAKALPLWNQGAGANGTGGAVPPQLRPDVGARTAPAPQPAPQLSAVDQTIYGSPTALSSGATYMLGQGEGVNPVTGGPGTVSWPSPGEGGESGATAESGAVDSAPDQGGGGDGGETPAPAPAPTPPLSAQALAAGVTPEQYAAGRQALIRALLAGKGITATPDAYGGAGQNPTVASDAAAAVSEAQTATLPPPPPSGARPAAREPNPPIVVPEISVRPRGAQDYVPPYPAVPELLPRPQMQPPGRQELAAIQMLMNPDPNIKAIYEPIRAYYAGLRAEDYKRQTAEWDKAAADTYAARGEERKAGMNWPETLLKRQQEAEGLRSGVPPELVGAPGFRAAALSPLVTMGARPAAPTQVATTAGGVPLPDGYDRRLGTAASPQRDQVPVLPNRPAGVSINEWATSNAPAIAKAQQAYEIAAPQLEDAIKTLQALKSHPGVAHGVGAGGSIYRSIPGSAGGADLQTYLDKVMGENFLAAYAGLRGGGAITNIEGQKASAAKSRINPNLDPEAFVRAVNETESTIRGDLERVQRQLHLPVTAWQMAPGEGVAPDVGQIGTFRGKPARYNGGNPHSDSSWTAL